MSLVGLISQQLSASLCRGAQNVNLCVFFRLEDMHGMSMATCMPSEVCTFSDY